MTGAEDSDTQIDGDLSAQELSDGRKPKHPDGQSGFAKLEHCRGPQQARKKKWGVFGALWGGLRTERQGRRVHIGHIVMCVTGKTNGDNTVERAVIGKIERCDFSGTVRS